VPRARLAVVLVSTLGIGACSGDDDDGASAPPPPPPMPEYLIDAAPEPLAGEPATMMPSYDPASGYHLDDAEATAPGGVRRSERAAPRERRILALMLKSTPSGATAAVDGKVVGRTPLLWEGEFTGREREFTFVLPGYSMARYRFVPIRDGFVHGRLHRVAIDIGDAGVPEIPVPAPAPAPATAPSPRPRPRPVPPVDAALPAPLAPTTPVVDAAPAAAAPQDAGL